MIPIKVVIADDHTLFREGLRKILSLEKDILVAGEAANGEEASKLAERIKPDVLLMDLKMPKSDLVQSLLEMSTSAPATKVLVLTAYSDEENVLNAAKSGARGYVSKGVPTTSLIQAIKAIHGGGTWVDKDIPCWQAFEEIAGSYSGSAREILPIGDESIQSLTKRELEILKLVAEGLTNEEIGKKIFISEKTVKTHLTNIFDKLKVNNRFKAALMLMGQTQN
jgi:two-component system, NarL family, response regulator DegU